MTTRYAEVEGGVVQFIHLADPRPVMHPEAAARIVVCTDDSILVRATWNGSVFANDPAETARQAKVTQDATDYATVRADPALKALLALTPAQIDAWVASNVTGIAGAQQAIKLLARAVLLLARQQVP